MSTSFIDDKKIKKSAGFTLIEILIVIALMSLVYSMVLPQFSTNASLAFDSLSRLSNDVRSAVDTAILSGRNHRLVFDMKSGKYWLEETYEENVYLPEKRDKGGADLDKTLLEEKKAKFDQKFERYADLAGEAVKDDKDDSQIPPPSPVISAKKRLEDPVWIKVENMEWGERQLNEIIVINDIKAEHHDQPILYESISSEEEALILVNITSSGYIEQTLMHIYYRNGDGNPNFEKPPFTFLIHPTLGTGTYVTGLREVGENGELKESEFL